MSVRVLVLGAHPDDAEFHAGGLLSRHCALGHSVRIVSVTNGAAGHHERLPQDLVPLRRAEAAEVGRRLACEYDVWDFPDGELQATLDVRRRIIEEIRRFAPDLVLTHRPCDYHPDHRAVGQAVQDASFLVTVPRLVPHVTALRHDPVVAYMGDLFSKPTPLQADVLLNVEREVDAVVRLLACHRSQVFEWLPYNQGLPASDVPTGEEARHEWLKRWYLRRARGIADRYRSAWLQRCGVEAGARVQAAEVYEISEYASPLPAARREALFPGGFSSAP